VSVSVSAPITAQGPSLLSARKQLDIVTAYREVGTYRGGAQMCGVTHKTLRRVVERGQAAERRTARRLNYASVRTLVATKIDETKGKISAKRLPPAARPPATKGRIATSGVKVPGMESIKPRRTTQGGTCRCCVKTDPLAWCRWNFDPSVTLRSEHCGELGRDPSSALDGEDADQGDRPPAGHRP